jgi:hypothetical protein
MSYLCESIRAATYADASDAAVTVSERSAIACDALPSINLARYFRSTLVHDVMHQTRIPPFILTHHVASQLATRPRHLFVMDQPSPRPRHSF